MATSQPSAPNPSPSLVRLVRNALTHLYDAAYLENHQLAAWLDRSGELDRLTRAQRLRRILLDCIEALRPPGSAGVGLEASRAYVILSYRYLDGMSMEDIAARRALSERQTYRELERGLEAVAALLEERFGKLAVNVEEHAPPDDVTLLDQLQVAQVEVARLGQTVTAEAFAPGDVLRGIGTMLAPILEQLGVRFDLRSPVAWPDIVADRVMFRQAMLNLLTYASRLVAPGDIAVAVVEDGGQLQIAVMAEGESPADRATGTSLSENDTVRLSLARSLIEAQGGQFETESLVGRWLARVRFRTVARRIILVVDDNQDLIALFQRYVAGRDITVVAAKESTRAVNLAAELQPALITLDVMMPNLDGWDVLQRLKAMPQTTHIPIAVCSVLREPELAREMGACDYLTKPVQQADLLALIGRHLGRPPLTT